MERPIDEKGLGKLQTYRVVVNNLPEMEGTDILARTAYSKSQAVDYDAKRFESAVGARTHISEMNQLLKALKLISKGSSVLEVGCGTGRLLMECVKRGYAVTGCDASAAMLEICKQKQERQTGTCGPLYLGEAAAIPLPSEAFDLVYAIRVLNQTESRDYAARAIVEMLRVTKPGGHVLVECVNAQRPRILWGRHGTTRLSVADIVAAGAGGGGKCAGVSGAFLLGMGARQMFGDLGARMMAVVDDYFATWAPLKCARIYVTLQKLSNTEAA